MSSADRQSATHITAAPENDAWGTLAQCCSCGAWARRRAAKLCARCGRRFEGGYRPTALLRQTYRTTEIHQSEIKNAVGTAVRCGGVVTGATADRGVAPSKRNVNAASLASLAFVTYALVPYLGIVFCPPAIVMGGLGLAKWRRAPRAGGRAASIAGVALGLALLAAQLFLWWVVYKIPGWAL